MKINARDSAKPAPRLPRWRSWALLSILLGCFTVLTGRAVYLQGLNHDFYQAKGEARYQRSMEIAAMRGVIVDRNNSLLAISTPVESVAASPADIDITREQSRRLARLLQIKEAELARKLEDRNREFVYLKRQLPPEQAAKIVELNIPGVFLRREFRRAYPAGEELAHVIGLTNIDGKGQEALELALEQKLRGKPGFRRVIRDRKGRIVEDVESIRAPQHGERITLTIDAKLQHLANRELKKALALHRAKAGGIVVLDAQTGEVLAMANLPTYDPNDRGQIDPQRKRNRAVTDLFEPGSTLKPFTVAAALEAGTAAPGTVIQTGAGQLTIGKHTISDTQPAGALTVAQVVQKSSNVGTAKLALQLPSASMWNLFNAVGFGIAPDIGFPGAVAGRLRAHESWRPIEQATMSYGHGVSVSLLQLARAYTIFASDGELKPATLIRDDGAAAQAAQSTQSQRVLSPRTAQAVRQMLEMAVAPGGTGPKAQVAGYRVAGKTGTAHKVEGRGYAAKRYISSFVGFAPVSNPRLIVAVMIDEPGAGQHYGGLVAAPVFSEVIGDALRMMGVAPDAPVERITLPTAPLIREEV
ncbi:MAG: penicillin-binding protein 2 [Betaproteobacteria bacterium]|nr:penicillin-binding protein 2 [Betaproteobacteria bacterium]